MHINQVSFPFYAELRGTGQKIQNKQDDWLKSSSGGSGLSFKGEIQL